MADFTGNENKGIIWDILVEQKIFENVESKHKYEIKDIFEQTILITEKQGRGLSLIEKNKEVIKTMVIKLDTFKKQLLNKPPVPRQYTNDELHKERQSAFERELKRKQTEFDGLTRTAPEKIDFSDIVDEKIGDKMDMLLAETIASRERQLNQVLQTQTPEQATKWIEGNLDENGIENKGQNINLKIGNDTYIQDNLIVNLDKKVSFNDTNKIQNFSIDSAPNTITPSSQSQSQSQSPSQSQSQSQSPSKQVNSSSIENTFFKMLKKEELDTPNTSSFHLNKFDTNTSEKIIEKDMKYDIINIKQEIKDVNEKINQIFINQTDIITLLRSIVK